MSDSTTTTTNPPVLRWKPNWLSKEKDLKKVTTSTTFPTLKDALNEVDRRKGKNVVLLTRTATGWIVFEYVGSSICKVNFKKIILGGLPLGGDPLIPQTYIFDGKDRFSRIVYQNNKYHIQETPRPTKEPTNPWVVEAVVPVEEFNDGKSLTWLPRITLRPTIDELPAALSWVSKNLSGVKIKAGGSKHSWSQVAVT